MGFEPVVRFYVSRLHLPIIKWKDRNVVGKWRKPTHSLRLDSGSSQVEPVVCGGSFPIQNFIVCPLKSGKGGGKTARSGGRASKGFSFLHVMRFGQIFPFQ